MGIGIGVIMATAIMTSVKNNYQMSKTQIEDKARSMGMVYPEDVKVINSKEVSK
jgi:hypothetical protein